MTYAYFTLESPTIIFCSRLTGVAMEIRFNNFPTVFTRLKGDNGKLREYCALVSPSAEFSTIPQADAYHLGYTTGFPARPEGSKLTASYSGYINAPTILVKEVQLGRFIFENVEFITHDLPQETRFDVVLGRTILKLVKIEIDYRSKTLEIEA
jgi:hypothetical protein